MPDPYWGAGLSHGDLVAGRPVVGDGDPFWAGEEADIGEAVFDEVAGGGAGGEHVVVVDAVEEGTAGVTDDDEGELVFLKPLESDVVHLGFDEEESVDASGAEEFVIDEGLVFGVFGDVEAQVEGGGGERFADGGDEVCEEGVVFGRGLASHEDESDEVGAFSAEGLGADVGPVVGSFHGDEDPVSFVWFDPVISGEDSRDSGLAHVGDSGDVLLGDPHWS